MNSILEGLNQPQKQAVTHVDGPMLILAGAGSGKTRVITRRTAYLLQQGYAEPQNLFVATFTNKAAGEMKERVDKLVGDVKIPWIGTFHSICARILRKEIHHLGRSPDFTIMGKSDQLSILKDCIHQANLDDKLYTPKKILGSISSAKTQLKSVDEFAAMAHGRYPQIVAKLYELYEANLKAQNGLDFDDLIVKTVYLFQNHPGVLEKYQDMFKYIMVDEYQDVNYAQYMLAKLLAKKHGNICVVGDDDQSIYGFRGADVSLILRFEDDFKDAVIVKLEENYRSTNVILSAANSVVVKNADRKSKKLWTKQEGGEKITLRSFVEAREEAKYVISEIKKVCKDKKSSLSDFAVLYRTNSQSRALEEFLVQENLLYQIVGGLRFYDRKEIRDAAAYLKLIVNPKDYKSFQRIINTPARGIGTVTQNKIISESIVRDEDLLSIMKNASVLPRVGKKIQDTLSDFATVIELLSEECKRRKPSKFIDLMLDETGYRQMLIEQRNEEGLERLDNLEELITDAAEFEMMNPDLGIEAYLEKIALFNDIDEKKDGKSLIRTKEVKDWNLLVNTLKAQNTPAIQRIWKFLDSDTKELVVSLNTDLPLDKIVRRDLLMGFNTLLDKIELYNSKSFKEIKQGEELKKLLKKDRETLSKSLLQRMNRLLLEGAFADVIEKSQEEAEGKITLMTLHTAKGLEFPVVFIVGLEENILPHIRSLEEGKKTLLEEERRLFYVGITRAIKKLYLTYAKERTVNGKTHKQSPSRFLREIPEELTDTYVPEISKRSFARKASLLLDRKSACEEQHLDFKEGGTVYHKIFGKGTVESIEGNYITAHFQGFGKKTLSANYLSLNAVGPQNNIKTGDTIKMENGTRGVVKKVEGEYVFVVIGTKVEKVIKEKLTIA